MTSQNPAVQQTEDAIRREVYDKCLIHPRREATDEEIHRHQEEKCLFCRKEVRNRLDRLCPPQTP